MKNNHPIIVRFSGPNHPICNAPLVANPVEIHGTWEQEKLTPLFLLKYQNSLADAVADLGGRPEEINKAFAGFQKFLYQQAAAPL